MTMILTDAQALRPDVFIPETQLSFLPIQDIMNDLENTTTGSFSLQEFSKKYHVSPSCLSVHFRRAVGLNLMQYVTQSRLTRAKFLLRHAELSVAGAAQQFGYPDMSNFVRRFRAQFGQTPLQYRQTKYENMKK